jgi:hypothetical protein
MKSGGLLLHNVEYAGGTIVAPTVEFARMCLLPSFHQEVETNYQLRITAPRRMWPMPSRVWQHRSKDQHHPGCPVGVGWKRSVGSEDKALPYKKPKQYDGRWVRGVGMHPFRYHVMHEEEESNRCSPYPRGHWLRHEPARQGEGTKRRVWKWRGDKKG